MTAVLIFAVVLLFAVLLSELASRSVLSTAVLFLLAGFIAGKPVLGFMQFDANSPAILRLLDLALFSILFTDGMRVGINDLRSAWKLPGRALFFGLPLTMLGTAVLAHYIVGVEWIKALLIGAILSPTDPAFAAAIIGRKEIPQRLRHLLNVESGLNDGIALPFVIVLLALAGSDEIHFWRLAEELALGVAIGIVIPWVAGRVEQSRFFSVSKKYEPLFAFSIGLLIYALASFSHANLYLAAFFAGITVASVRSDMRRAFHQFGEMIAELLKLAALLVFGSLLSPKFFFETHWQAWIFLVLTLVASRPAALFLSMIGTPLNWREKAAAFWFGPKGFASVIYGLLVLNSNIADAGEIFHLVALVIVGSILAHSSTDVLVARWFCKEPDATT